jgi:hypothetical protein
LIVALADSHSIALIVTFAILWLINLFMWRFRIRPTIDARKSGEPSLYPWTAFDTVQLERFPNKKYQLLGKRYSLIGPRIPVNVQIDLPSVEAEELRTLILDWRRASKLASPALSNGGLSRKLGSFARWLTTPIRTKFPNKQKLTEPADVQ